MTTSLLLDLDLKSFGEEKVELGAHWDPMPHGAFTFHASSSSCIVTGRHGDVTVVDYHRVAKPFVRNFSWQGLELKRCAESEGAAASLRCGWLGHVLTTQVAFINEHCHRFDDPHCCMLCCASDDGLIRMCRCWGCQDHEPALVSCFQAMPKRQSAATCIHWLQSQAQLVVAGRDPLVRVWDLRREQMMCSFRHHSAHRVTSVAHWACRERSFGWLVFAGRGDGSLMSMDWRKAGGVVQSYQCSSGRAVTAVVPGVRPPCGTASECLLAALDEHGTVELVDIRYMRSYSPSVPPQRAGAPAASDADVSFAAAEYENWDAAATPVAVDRTTAHVGVLPLTRGRATNRSGRLPSGLRPPLLCSAPSSRGLFATARAAPEMTQAVSLSDLATGQLRITFPLAASVETSAFGFHPYRNVFGVLTRAGDGRRLLLYDGAVRPGG